jgi:hypothetical protein
MIIDFRYGNSMNEVDFNMFHQCLSYDFTSTL